MLYNKPFYPVYESMFLNYHHLRYFWAIAHEGGLTKAAARLNVAQSALSIQLRQLEENLGHRLFVRKNRTLSLTEAGHVALKYADSIFKSGEELIDTLQHRPHKARQVLRVGSVATLSRNFQAGFLRPLRNRSDVELVLRSGSMRDLMMQLHNHMLDVMLSNQAAKSDAERQHQSHLLDEQAVSLVGRPTQSRKKLRFPDDLRSVPMLAPSLESDVRVAFDLMLDKAGVRPIIAAEVDDMAMLRLLARNTTALALVPRVVVQDELRSGVLVERHRFSSIKESFYAITPTRTFPNQLVKDLINHATSHRKKS